MDNGEGSASQIWLLPEKASEWQAGSKDPREQLELLELALSNEAHRNIRGASREHLHQLILVTKIFIFLIND